jgi:hypothetical protein
VTFLGDTGELEPARLTVYKGIGCTAGEVFLAKTGRLQASLERFANN